MTDTTGPKSTPDGTDEHYQPWLHRGAAGGNGGVIRPSPLPTRRGEAAGEPPLVGTIRQGSELSAEELLARPIPAAPSEPEGPGIGERVSAGLAAFADWTIRLGERADVPARLAKLELGRRAKAALDWTGRSARAGVAGVSNATQAGIAAAAPKFDAAGKAARDALAKGASGAKASLGAGAAKIGEAARGLADSAPLPGKADEPVIESQLDRLLAEEGVAQPARATKPAQGLPLFGEAPRAAEPPSPPPAPQAAPASTPSSEPPRFEPAGGGGGLGGNSSNVVGSGGADRTWHRHPATLALGGAFLLAAGFAAGQYWTGPGVDRATTERVIHDYLLNNPEILPQAMQRLQATQAAATVNRLRSGIERPFSGAWAGAADGDVTLTVFTDYACTFCRASVPDIDRLLREDRKLKVVFRELPILSPESEPAARLALAAARRGRYMPMHRALFETGSPDAGARRDAAIALDVANDAAVLNDAAISRELQGNLTLARELGFDGTPSWVVGDRLLTGAVGYDQLRAAVAAAREG